MPNNLFNLFQKLIGLSLGDGLGGGAACDCGLLGSRLPHLQHCVELGLHLASQSGHTGNDSRLVREPNSFFQMLISSFCLVLWFFMVRALAA